jgi:2-(1,2-epoxy-1,2-dihydrophenyl)acetyl-CoA isomerase
MALLGDPITAEVAADWGLIWQVVDDDALMDTAQAMAASLAQGPAEALAGIKKALNQSTENNLDQQLELERNLQQVLGHSADYREGVTAFSEKRKPTFR